jgi:small subunit ribosomal protein S17e
MGRVKTKNIKRVGKQLIEDYPDEFSEDFTENKTKVNELTTVQTKPLRNKIAGYIVAEKKKVVD